MYRGNCVGLPRISGYFPDRRLETGTSPAACTRRMKRNEENELIRHEKTVVTNWEGLLDEITPEMTCTMPVEGKEILLLDNFLSKDECLRIIHAANEEGFGKTDYPKHYRGNLRLIASDQGLAARLYLRILNFVPHVVEEDGHKWNICGLNECWRLAKYHPGDRFGAHVDTFFQKSKTEKTMFTVNIYLNGDGEFVGGSTRFYAEPIVRGEPRLEEARVIPSPGRCLIFRQPTSAQYRHDGEEVVEGIKYLIRTDVNYIREDSDRNEWN